MISPMTHPLLSAPHGFFGRQGGVSTGAYTSLNAGIGSGDSELNIKENRNRIRQYLGADHLLSHQQIHSTKVHIITRVPDDLEKTDGPKKADGQKKADGMVTALPGLALSALSADCGPLLLADIQAGVIGACHAGWRGALAGIVENTVAAMCEIGAHPSQISAVLGPTIGPKSYAVGDEFRAEFLDVDERYAQFFQDGTPTHKQSGTPQPFFDLPAFILSRLENLGVTNTAWTGHDTYRLPAEFFSYRRNQHDGVDGYGRNLSAIRLPNSS